MENYLLPKGRTHFILGINDNEQLNAFLASNPGIIGVAFLGRSNVGKSSTINALFGKSTARVSNTPGRTRQVNVFEFELDGMDKDVKKFYLFDLPGYGHAEASKEMQKNWQLLIDCFFSHLSQTVCLINIQDARHPHQDADILFHKYIKQFNNETFLVLNKADKLKNQSERHRLKTILPDFLKEYKWIKKFFITSAEKGTGIKELHDSIVTFLLDKFEKEKFGMKIN